MENLGLIYIALGPGIAIAVYIYYSDKWEPEPKVLVVKSFFLGVIAFFPSGYLENSLQGIWRWEETGLDLWWKNLLFAFLGVALIEEGCKFLFLKGFVYDERDFNEPFDGIIYGGLVGCGFASMENLFYVFQYGYSSGMVRMLTAVPGHAFDGIILGYFMGKAKFSLKPTLNLAYGFGTVVLLHGIYDYAVFSPGKWFPVAMIFGIVFLGIYLGLKAKRQLEKHSESIEFSNKSYYLLQDGYKRGPFGMRALRDSLAENRIQLDDEVAIGTHGAKTTVREIFSVDGKIKKHLRSKGSATGQPEWLLIVYYVLTFGLYLYFWFLRNYRDFRNFKNIDANPELRTLILFGFSVIPLFVYGTILNLYDVTGYLNSPFEGLFIMFVSGSEAFFLLVQFQMFHRFMKRSMKGSFHPITPVFLFFCLSVTRKYFPSSFQLYWTVEIVSIFLQASILAWVQRDLNRYWKLGIKSVSNPD